MNEDDARKFIKVGAGAGLVCGVGLAILSVYRNANSTQNFEDLNNALQSDFMTISISLGAMALIPIVL